jgi:hypothetical protein
MMATIVRIVLKFTLRIDIVIVCAFSEFNST